MKQKHIVYIVSNIHKSLAFEWIASGLKDYCKLTFILLNPSSSYLEDFLKHEGVEVKRILYRNKRDFPLAFIRTFFYLLFKRPHIVHAHLFDAQLIGLTAAWLLAIGKRIYTRHTSNFHHVFHPRSVKFDVWCNRIATEVISISQATDVTLIELENVPSHKVVKIPHGFALNIFNEITEDQTEFIKEKWKIPRTHPVVGVVARHIEWKGIQYIIPAFQKFLNENPQACLVLANASGPYHEHIVQLLKSLPHDRIILIPFEEDVAALFSVFDLYVHTPIDSICEAFGQTYIESLASSVPSIFTASGIAAEFIVHDRNALVVAFKDSDGINKALMRLWNDQSLQQRLIKNGKQDVLSKFGLPSMLNSFKKLYDI